MCSELLNATYTDKATFVRDVVCQFQLVEGDHLKNPLKIVSFHIFVKLCCFTFFWKNCVFLHFWKTFYIFTFCIQCSPVAGLSGWMYIRFGISGSAFPATIHWLKSRTFNFQYYWTPFFGGCTSVLVSRGLLSQPPSIGWKFNFGFSINKEFNWQFLGGHWMNLLI